MANSDMERTRTVCRLQTSLALLVLLANPILYKARQLIDWLCLEKQIFQDDTIALKLNPRIIGVANVSGG